MLSFRDPVFHQKGMCPHFLMKHGSYLRSSTNRNDYLVRHRALQNAYGEVLHVAKIRNSSIITSICQVVPSHLLVSRENHTFFAEAMEWGETEVSAPSAPRISCLLHRIRSAQCLLLFVLSMPFFFCDAGLMRPEQNSTERRIHFMFKLVNNTLLLYL